MADSEIAEKVSEHTPTVERFTFEWWRSLPDRCRQLVVVSAVVAFPGLVLIYSGDTENWVYGAERMLDLKSVYRPLYDTSPTNPLPVALYPYLPVFAILNAILYVPLQAIDAVFNLPPDVTSHLKLVIAGSWGYVALLSLPVFAQSFYDTSHSRFRAGVLVLALPAVWTNYPIRGTDVLVAGLAVAGIAAAVKGRWLLAGIVIGFSTFKFTGIPFAGVLAGYALVTAGWKPFGKVAVGGIVSQIPNILYFAVFPADFWLLLRRRGSLSYWSHEVTGVVLQPIVQTGLTDWYIETGFTIVVVVFTAVGILVAVRRSNLVLGFAVAYISTSFLVTSKIHRVIPFYVLLVLAAADNWDSRLVRGATLSVLTLRWYEELFLVFNLEYITAVYIDSWDRFRLVVVLATVFLLGVLLFRRPTKRYATE